MVKVSNIEAQTWLNAFSSIFKKPPSLIVLETCSSTMDIGKKVLKGETADFRADYLFHGDSRYTACFSLLQKKGRGRNFRTWQSDDEGGIYLSIADSKVINLSTLQGFSLVIGLAIVRNLKSYDIDAQLKWPNDVYVNEKKIAGVLIETVPVFNGNGSQLIIGIGLNVNQHFFGENLKATSMLIAKNKQFEYESVSAKLVKSVLDIVEEYFFRLPENCFLPFKSEWWDNCNMSGRLVENIELKISGTAVGLSDEGALIVDDGGIKHEISVGDVGIVV